MYSHGKSPSRDSKQQKRLDTKTSLNNYNNMINNSSHINQRSSIPVKVEDDILRNSLIKTITNKPLEKSTLSSMDNIKKEINDIDNDPGRVYTRNKQKSNYTNINDSSYEILNDMKENPPTKTHERNLFISIDSRYRDRTLSIKNGLRYNLALNQNTNSYGTIGLNYPLDYVTEIEVMDSIIFPKKNQNNVTYENDGYFNEITMLINEIYNQSYINPINRFHFTFNITDYDSIRYKLPIPYNAIFKLPQPVNLDKTLTLNFFTPTISADIDEDVLQLFMYYTNPATIEVGGPTDPVSNNILSTLTNGDVIAFENFTSSYYEYNSNNPNSILSKDKFYPVTNTINQYTFTIPIDLLNTPLVNDINAPRGNPYTLANNVGFGFDGVDGNFLKLGYINNIANIGDTIIIKSVESDRVPDYPNNYTLLTRVEGWNIFSIQNNNYNSYNYYSYSINYDWVNNPIWDPNNMPYIGLIYINIIFNTKPPTVKTVNCYVGSRRIRIPLRIKTLYNEK